MSGLYDIMVIPDETSINAVDIKWDLQLEKEKKKLNGIYRLRANEESITVETFWKIYINLTQVESSFKSMKSGLGIRPIHHQKEQRVDAHLFITLLAYHISRSIRYRLQKQGIKHNGEMARDILSDHVRVITMIKAEDDQAIHIRKNSRSSSAQKRIYNALDMFNCLVKSLKQF